MEHTLKGCAHTRTVWLNGRQLNPELSQSYINHSPDGFAWGYSGSGPAQLALAICIECTGRIANYQEFKERVIAALPFGEDFDIKFNL